MNRLVFSLCLSLTLACAPLLLCRPCTAAETPATPAQAIPLSGKVMETMDGGGYTYLRLKSGNDTSWVAVPLMKVTVGQELSLIPGFEMKNFTSKALNRKFDKVIFSAGVANQKIPMSPSAIKMLHEGVAASAKANEAPPKAPAKAPVAAPVAAPAAPVQRVDIDMRRPAAPVKRVAKAKGPNAHTVAELFAKRTKLERKVVVVRGRIVKAASHIMKKSWYHIQDGTGSPKHKNDDIVVVSNSDLPKEGDLVTFTGTLFNNIDYGSGYKYEVIVLDASFKR